MNDKPKPKLGFLLGGMARKEPAPAPTPDPEPPAIPAEAIYQVPEIAPNALPTPAKKPSLLEAFTVHAEAEAEKREILFKEPPKDFKAMLDHFDSLINKDTGIDQYNIDFCREYVKKIYLDLRQQPELEGLMIDRDVRNVIMFIRATKSRAIEAGEVKKVKAEKKAKIKPSARFGNIGGTFDMSLMVDSLEDFSNMGDL